MKTKLNLLAAGIFLAALGTGLGQTALQFSTNIYYVAENAGSVILTVQRIGDTNGVVSLDYASTNGTAIAGSDYMATNGTLTFLAGETNQTIAVLILNDGLVEAVYEAFTVTMSNPNNAVLGTRTTANGRITDNDKGLAFEFANYWAREDEGSVLIGVARADDGNLPVSVDFATSDQTATNGLDYTATNGTFSFVVGEKLKLFTIPILNDSLKENSKTFRVTLSNPINQVLGSQKIVTVTIRDNDPGVQFEFANYSVAEDAGSVLIGVTRGDEGELPVRVDFATSDLTATNGLDYTATNGTFSFAAGEKVKLFTVPVLNDGLKEANKTVRLTLSNPTNQVLGTQKIATIAITDNDPGVQFTQNQLWVHENEGTILLTVTRGNDGQLGAFTVDYATTNSTAIAGSDYVDTHGTLEFAAGEMTQSITVSVFDEGVAEPDEQFKVGLSNPTGGMALGAAASVTATVTVCDTTEMRPHRFSNFGVSPEGVVSLTLGGGYTPGVGLLNRFQPYFDVYPVEVSTNLVDWMPFQWRVRTNFSTNPLAVVDTQSPPSNQRFYRTPTSSLVAPLPPPTGPFAVGRVDRFVSDPNLRNRNKISTNNSFGITIWYPAERQAGQLPSLYDEEPIAKDIGYWPGWIDRIPRFRSHSVQNAPIAIHAGRCPVVFSSHGYGAYRQDSVDKTENLASHGYVIVAVDHFDCSCTVLPDGRYFSDADMGWRPMTADGTQNRVQDFVCLLQQLEIWNVQDPLLSGRLDLEKLATIGFSWGGSVAANFCLIEPRCLAAIGLDGGKVPGPLMKPTLTMRNDQDSDMSLFNDSSPAYWFQISNTEHASFWSGYWSLNRNLASGREASRTMNAFALWFLNKYLKGCTDPMPALADYPRVINFKQK